MGRGHRPGASVLSSQAGSVYAVAFTPDGRLVAAASADGTTRAWDVGTGKVDAALAGHTGPALTLAFSPDGSSWLPVGRIGVFALPPGRGARCDEKSPGPATSRGINAAARMRPAPMTDRPPPAQSLASLATSCGVNAADWRAALLRLTGLLLPVSPRAPQVAWSGAPTSHCDCLAS